MSAHKTRKRDKATTSRKKITAANGAQKRREAELKLIREGKHTRAEIVKRICRQFKDVKPVTVETELSDGMNPVYNRFPCRIRRRKRDGVLYVKK